MVSATLLSPCLFVGINTFPGVGCGGMCGHVCVPLLVGIHWTQL